MELRAPRDFRPDCIRKPLDRSMEVDAYAPHIILGTCSYERKPYYMGERLVT